MQTRAANESQSYYRCDPCNLDLAVADVRHIRAGSGTMPTCSRCGTLVRQESSRAIRPLNTELLHAIARTFGAVPLLITLGVGTVAVVVSLITRWPIGAAIEAGYFFSTLRAEAAGADHAEIDADDIGAGHRGLALRLVWIGPALRYAMTTLVAFMPALLSAWLLGPSGGLVSAALSLAGLVYLPAGLIVAAQADRGFLSAFDIVTALRLVFRIPGAYFTAFGYLVGLTVLGSAPGFVVDVITDGEVSLVLSVIARVASFVAFIAMARVLGTLMYEHREEL